MNNEQRIKLAEAVFGYIRVNNADVWVHKMCISADRQEWDDRDAKILPELPDPFTNANDCEAVIRWLNGNEYVFVIQHGDQADYARDAVSLFDSRARFIGSWIDDDWKQGVCGLALKVIDDE